MLTEAEKTDLKRILSILLQDETIVKGLSDQILVMVNSTIIDYRKEFLEKDAERYSERVLELEKRLREILSQSLKDFDIKTERLYTNVHHIAEEKVHSIVNGSLVKLQESIAHILENQASAEKKREKDMNDVFIRVGEVKKDLDKVADKTLYSVAIRAISDHPVRTVLGFTLFSAFTIGTLLKIYNIELDLISWGKALLKLIGINI